MIDWEQVKIILPAAIPFGFAMLILMVDTFNHGSEEEEARTAGLIEWMGLAALVITIGAGIFITRDSSSGDVVLKGFSKFEDSAHAHGSVTYDGLAKFGAVLIPMLGCLSLLLVVGTAKQLSLRVSELVAVHLLSVSGLILLVLASDFMTAFVALELLSIALYVMSACDRSSSRSVEAGMKYFIMGSVASAFIVYGIALFYGGTGTLYMDDAQAISVGAKSEFGVFLKFGIMLIAAGFLFKLGAVPFHMWVPDVYEGAPTSIVGHMAVTVKLAVMVVVYKVFVVALAATGGTATDVLYAVSIASIVIGNIFALTQTNLKRMLAYSSISHAGFAIMGLASVTTATHGMLAEGATASLFYVLAYGFMTLGAFATLVLAREENRSVETLSSIRGLWKRNPAAAIAMMVFMASLAGIPPTGGFTAKVLVIMSAIHGHAYWLAGVGIFMSIIAVYYYFRVIAVMMEPSEIEAGKPGADDASPTVIICAIVTLILGVLPGVYINFAARGQASLGDFIRSLGIG